MFPNLVPSYRWKKQYRNVQVGDVVLMMNESKVSTRYRLALVKTADPDKDGLVRKLVLQYKNVDTGRKYKKGGYGFSETERAIHKVVVIKPWTGCRRMWRQRSGRPVRSRCSTRHQTSPKGNCLKIKISTHAPHKMLYVCMYMEKQYKNLKKKKKEARKIGPY